MVMTNGDVPSRTEVVDVESKIKSQELSEDRQDFSDYAPLSQEGVVCQKFDGRYGVYYVLRSPSRSYLKLDPENYYLWSKMDGNTTVTDLTFAYFSRSGDLALRRLSVLIGTLSKKGFLANPPKQLNEEVQVKSKDNKIASLGDRIIKFYLKHEFPIYGLDGLLTRLYNVCIRFLYTQPALILFWAITLVGLVLFTYIVFQGSYNLISINSTGLDIISVYVTLLITIPLHEGAHAFTVKHYGREVNRGGAMIYLGSPAFFVDTQDIWLADRRARIAVSWAGPFSNFILSGFLIGLLYACPNIIVNRLLFQMATVSYLIAIVNLNPLLELDGYYILMDWLEIPSLRQRSFMFLQGKLFYKIKHRVNLSSKEHIYIVYGLLGGTCTIYMVWLAARYLGRHIAPLTVELWKTLGVEGKLIIAVIMLVIVVPLASSILRRLHLSIRQIGTQ
jgi:putative peptide zinc metalloprotease protein